MLVDTCIENIIFMYLSIFADPDTVAAIENEFKYWGYVYFYQLGNNIFSYNYFEQISVYKFGHKN